MISIDTAMSIGQVIEVSHPIAATTNSGVVSNGEDTSGLAVDYYGIHKKSLSTCLVVPKS
jgi:hypothetical protein